MNGKAVLFSKTGKEMEEMSDTRLITVRTHLLKILEKTIMYKLLGENSDLIKVGDIKTDSLWEEALTRIY